jgi:hypothetical protein
VSTIPSSRRWPVTTAKPLFRGTRGSPPPPAAVCLVTREAQCSAVAEPSVVIVVLDSDSPEEETRAAACDLARGAAAGSAGSRATPSSYASTLKGERAQALLSFGGREEERCDAYFLSAR